eukprot:scaffold88303_cov59-Phaeocystis_antarctica.AAC.1
MMRRSGCGIPCCTPPPEAVRAGARRGHPRVAGGRVRLRLGSGLGSGLGSWVRVRVRVRALLDAQQFRRVRQVAQAALQYVELGANARQVQGRCHACTLPPHAHLVRVRIRVRIRVRARVRG